MSENVYLKFGHQEVYYATAGMSRQRRMQVQILCAYLPLLRNVYSLSTSRETTERNCPITLYTEYHLGYARELKVSWMTLAVQVGLLNSLSTSFFK